MEFHIMCGIPASGKSTLAQSLPGYQVSTDRIRKFLWDNEAIVEHDKLVFSLADEMIKYMLSRGESVVFDATNLSLVRRKKCTEMARKYQASPILHFCDCPLKTALVRNSLRDRKVPEIIIRVLYKSLQTPNLEEDFDIIKIYDENSQLKQTLSKEK